MKYKRDKKFIESIPEEWRDVPMGALVSHPELGCGFLRGEVSGDARITWLIGDAEKPLYASWSDLTPITQWEPKEGEVVAAWDDGMTYVTLVHYSETDLRRDFQHGTIEGSRWTNVARIPDDLLMKDADMTVVWWIANGELYEADHE